MEFVRFPTFLGNRWTSEMEIGIFGVVFKTFVVKRIFQNRVFYGMKWNVLNGYEINSTICKKDIHLNERLFELNSEID